MSHIHDVAVQFWQELVSRPSGPLAFRFILQPVMATLLAIRDGYHDARANRSPYLWTILHDPLQRGPRLHEGFVSLTRVLLLAVVMDVIYQIIRLHGLRPLQTLDIAFIFAFLPYLILRGPAARVIRYMMRRKADRSAKLVPHE